MQKNIAIVGAGLVGSMLACYLSRRGHKVSVYIVAVLKNRLNKAAVYGGDGGAVAHPFWPPFGDGSGQFPSAPEYGSQRL